MRNRIERLMQQRDGVLDAARQIASEREECMRQKEKAERDRDFWCKDSLEQTTRADILQARVKELQDRLEELYRVIESARKESKDG